MSNHSSKIDTEMFGKLFGDDKEFKERTDAREEFIKSIMDELGPTKKFPEGKLTEHDEGELQFAVGITDGKVVIEFGSQVTWLGMKPAQAKSLGKLLINKANNIMNSEFK